MAKCTATSFCGSPTVHTSDPGLPLVKSASPTFVFEKGDSPEMTLNNFLKYFMLNTTWLMQSNCVVQNKTILGMDRHLRYREKKGRYLTQSYDKIPFTHRKIQKATWQHKNATKNFDYTMIVDRLRKSLHVTLRNKPISLTRSISTGSYATSFTRQSNEWW